jgi:HlyD family secretion protein
MLQRRLLISLALSLVVIAVIFGFWLSGIIWNSASQNSGDNYRVGKVVLGDLKETVGITGQLEANGRRDLFFLVAGKAAQIPVQPGQAVKAGDLLIQLDTTALELDLADAEMVVQLQQLAFEQLLAGAGKYDVAATSAAVAQAQAQLDRLQQPPNKNSIIAAQQNLEASRLALWQAQLQRDNLNLSFVNDSAPVQAAVQQIDSAELGIDVAEQQLINAQQGVSSQDIAVARASVAQAQASLTRLLQKPSTIDQELGMLQIEQARLALDRVRIALNDAHLSAPTDGVVAQVNYEVGQSIAPGLPAVVFVGEGGYHLDVLVDELDIVRIEEGQLAFVSLDAFPGVSLPAHVEYIAPDAVTVGGVVSYEVRLLLDPTDVSVRDGMTATAEIVVSELTHILLVPNWGIRIDRTSGKSFVNIRRADGSIEEVEIVLGVRGEEFSEVKSGLRLNDEIVVDLARSGISITDNSGSN